MVYAPNIDRDFMLHEDLPGDNAIEPITKERLLETPLDRLQILKPNADMIIATDKIGTGVCMKEERDSNNNKITARHIIFSHNGIDYIYIYDINSKKLIRCEIRNVNQKTSIDGITKTTTTSEVYDTDCLKLKHTRVGVVLRGENTHKSDITLIDPTGWVFMTHKTNNDNTGSITAWRKPNEDIITHSIRNHITFRWTRRGSKIVSESVLENVYKETRRIEIEHGVAVLPNGLPILT